MNATDKSFETFARGLVPSQQRLDPETLRKAQEWYTMFTGSHAVKMSERDLVEIYQELH